jgi:hypothetical protein
MAEGLVGITCRPLNAHPLDCGQHDHLKMPDFDDGYW